MTERDSLMELDRFIEKTNKRMNKLECELVRIWTPALHAKSACCK